MDPSEPPRFLLLLPPAPTSPTASALTDAYADTLIRVLKEIALHAGDSAKAAILEIALACPHLVGARSRSRSSLYQQTQSLLSAVYKFVCVTAARENINVEDADGVDVRILLIAWSPDAEPEPPTSTPCSVIVDLTTLAKSRRAWQYAFGVESAAGKALVRAFVEAKGGADDPTDARGGTATKGSHEPTSLAGAGGHLHSDVAVGGTFDHLHIGHKLLLTMTLFAVDDRQGDQDRSATIGITGDQLLVNKKHAGLVESWTDRQEAVAEFSNAILDFSPPSSSEQRRISTRNEAGPNGKSTDICYPNGLVLKCTEIQDPFGPTITDKRISALIISGETRSGGKAVNDKRKEKGWKELEVFEVDVLDADEEGAATEGFEGKLSSTAIREKLARKAAESKI